MRLTPDKRLVNGVVAVVLPVFFAVFLWRFVISDNDRAAGGSNGIAQILVVNRDGPDAFGRDDDLHGILAGDLVLGENIVTIASCSARVDWLDDIALDGWIAISTDPGLVRASELAADARFYDPLAYLAIEQVEEKFWELDGDLRAVEEWVYRVADVTDRTLMLQYLIDRAEPPSDEAVGRFTVYATSRATTRQMIVYLDAKLAQPNQLERSAGKPTDGRVLFAGSSDEPISVPNRECERVADDLREQRDAGPATTGSSSARPRSAADTPPTSLWHYR